MTLIPPPPPPPAAASRNLKVADETKSVCWFDEEGVGFLSFLQSHCYVSLVGKGSDSGTGKFFPTLNGSPRYFSFSPLGACDGSWWPL